MPQQQLSNPATFVFGPRETKGVISGVSARQTIGLAVTVVLAFMALRLAPQQLSLPAAALCVGLGSAFTFWPYNGRPCIEWTDIALRYAVLRVGGRTRYESIASLIGHMQTLDVDDYEIETPTDLPGELEMLEIVAHPAPGGGDGGVIYDADDHTYCASLLVAAQSFALLDEGEQLQRLQGWSDVMANYAREDSVVSRLQWCESTLPADSNAMLDYFSTERDEGLEFDSQLIRSYLALQDRAAAVEQAHELTITLQIDGASRRARKSAKRLGDGHEGFATLLMREMAGLANALEAAGVEVQGLLSPRALALRIREGANPYFAAARRDEGLAVEQMGPRSSEAHWRYYEVDNVLTATYWIAQWPRIGVGATFLAPLILGTAATRTVAVTCYPVPPLKAMRRAEAASTAIEGEQDARARRGFRIGARQRRQEQAAVDREAQLANGHAEIVFAGFITVAGRNEDELDAACAQVEQAAGQARLELQRLDGEHDTAVTYTMPLARGLSTGMF